MPSKADVNRTFDARPDRIDYRDRVYMSGLHADDVLLSAGFR